MLSREQRACTRNTTRNLLVVLLGVCLAAAVVHNWQPCSSSSSSRTAGCVNRLATPRRLLASARSVLGTNSSSSSTNSSSSSSSRSSRASNRSSVAVSSTGASRKPRASPQPAKWGGLRDAANWPMTSGNIEDSRGTQAEAFTSTQGPDEEDNPGDPFNAYTTEKSSIEPPAGAYFDDDGDQVLSLDAQLGVWGSSWAGHRGRASRHRPNFRRQNPTRTKVGNTTISHFKLEAGTQRGVQAMSGTFEGARAAAGSDSSFNLADNDNAKGLPLGLASVYSSNNEASGPTPGRHIVVRDGERRSVAFTNIAPTSAAQSGTGYGVAASAAGWEVAASSRSDRSTEEPRATIGHRPPGKNGAFDSSSSSSGDRRRRRRLLLSA